MSWQRHGRALLAVLLTAPFLSQADATIANVATPAIQKGLHASATSAELVIGGYLIAFAVLLITGARLGQTHGYKRVFMLGTGLFMAASLLAGLAPDAAVLVITRVVQGAGAALMFPQALTGIQLNFAGAERIRAIGLYGIALSGGAVTGQILGGVLITADLAGTGWRAIFLVNVPVCAAALAAAARRLPADEGHGDQKVDFAGVAILSVTVLLMVLPLILGRPEGWPAWTWVSLVASVPVLAVFIVVQRRTSARGNAPLVNLQVLTRPTVAWGLFTLMTATATYYALLFTLAQYLQNGLGHGPLVSGLILVPWVAAFGLAGQTARRMPGRVARVLPAAGCALLTAAYLAISADLFAGSHGLGPLIPLLAAGGFGLGTQFSSLLGRLTNAVPPRYAPDISGVSTTVLQIGGALGVAVFGAVYLSGAAPHDTPRTTHAFAVTALVLGCAALLSTACSWLTIRSGDGPAEESSPTGSGESPADAQVIASA
ncbi:MFS transporter [Actinoallomurus vinaceus]|uniref:MFS transporter n=1 Tax=Actinoallomurus vinaceus TaxID=1080074 RepID=A0ABP8UCW7_9ACTN